MIHLLLPWVLLALPLPLGVGWLGARQQQRQRQGPSGHNGHHLTASAVERLAGAILPPPGLVEALRSASSATTSAAHAGTVDRPPLVNRRWREIAQTGLHWLAWGLLLLALAQPVWRGGAVEQLATGRALMLVVDLSGSMDKRDFQLDGQAVTRLTAVKTAVADFIARNPGDRLGLVLFGDEAFVAVPMTFDAASVSHAMAEAAIGLAGRTTAIGDALGLALVKLRDETGSGRAIVLLSDGTNNAGSAEPEDAAALAAELGVRIYSIGLGSSTADGTTGLDPSSDLDEPTLRAVADLSGGAYFRATNLESLQEVYRTIAQLERNPTSSPPLAQQVSLQPLATLALLVLLIILGLWRGTA